MLCYIDEYADLLYSFCLSLSLSLSLLLFLSFFISIVMSNPRAIPANSASVIKIKTKKAVCAEISADCRALGRFVLRIQGVTVAAGLITELA